MFICASEGSETRTISASSQFHTAALDGKETCRGGGGAVPRCHRGACGCAWVVSSRSSATPAQGRLGWSISALWLKEERSAPCSSPYTTTTHRAPAALAPRHPHRHTPAQSAFNIAAQTDPPIAAALARVSYRCSAREAETHSDTAGWPRHTHAPTAEGEGEGKDTELRRRDERIRDCSPLIQIYDTHIAEATRAALCATSVRHHFHPPLAPHNSPQAPLAHTVLAPPIGRLRHGK